MLRYVRRLARTICIVASRRDHSRRHVTSCTCMTVPCWMCSRRERFIRNKYEKRLWMWDPSKGERPTVQPPAVPTTASPSTSTSVQQDANNPFSSFSAGASATRSRRRRAPTGGGGGNSMFLGQPSVAAPAAASRGATANANGGAGGNAVDLLNSLVAGVAASGAPATTASVGSSPVFTAAPKKAVAEAAVPAAALPPSTAASGGLDLLGSSGAIVSAGTKSSAVAADGFVKVETKASEQQAKALKDSLMSLYQQPQVVQNVVYPGGYAMPMQQPGTAAFNPSTMMHNPQAVTAAVPQAGIPMAGGMMMQQPGVAMPAFGQVAYGQVQPGVAMAMPIQQQQMQQQPGIRQQPQGGTAPFTVRAAPSADFRI